MNRQIINPLMVKSSKSLFFFKQISMTAKQTRAKTEQLAQTYWLISTARVL